MSNDELNKYNEMYHRLVEQLVHLHNRNLFFIQNTDTVRPQMEIRAIIKQIQIITKEMKAQTKLVHAEGIANRREKRRLAKDKKQANRYRQLRKENINDNNSTTPSSI
jgi:hypothetical protein